MIFEDCTVLSVQKHYARIVNNDSDEEYNAWYPTVLSRMPIVGERVVVDKDDVDGTNCILVQLYDDEPLLLGSHVHQLLQDSVIDNMPVLNATKNDLRTKTTGGIV